MKSNKLLITAIHLLFAIARVPVFAQRENPGNSRFIDYTVDIKRHNLKLYWKDDKNENFRSIQNLKLWLEKNKQKFVFAMNAGMYQPGNSPQGLFIEEQKVLSPLDTLHGKGNFYVKPNGVFYITVDNDPAICTTGKFADNNGKIKYATQSGPMLVMDGQINALFKKGSINLNSRNEVGILPDNKVVFVMSKKEINFYDFANYFKSIGVRMLCILTGLYHEPTCRQNIEYKPMETSELLSVLHNSGRLALPMQRL